MKNYCGDHDFRTIQGETFHWRHGMFDLNKESEHSKQAWDAYKDIMAGEGLTPAGEDIEA